MLRSLTYLFLTVLVGLSVGQWDKTDFTKKSIDLKEIISGGVGKDKIRSIDKPQFQTIDEADFRANEPMLVYEFNNSARAYPLGALIRHEIVNDIANDIPIAVTYCPLCNSSVIFDRRIEGKVLEFGVSGLLRYSDMLMYDRQTQSLWQQFIGKAVVGELNGKNLKILPSKIQSFALFMKEYPKGQVLISKSNKYNPYFKYDSSSKPSLYLGEYKGKVSILSRVVAVGDIAWALELVKKQKKIQYKDIFIEWNAGQNSALDTRIIAEGKDVGNITVYRIKSGKKIPVIHQIPFAFAFKAFFPKSKIITQ